MFLLKNISYDKHTTCIFVVVVFVFKHNLSSYDVFLQGKKGVIYLILDQIQKTTLPTASILT